MIDTKQKRAVFRPADSPKLRFGFPPQHPHVICRTCIADFIILLPADGSKQKTIDRVLAEHEGHDFDLEA